ncbi:MAG TPA: DEAD/DEAH box helicase family protein [Dehalococcoidales bacterium]
MIVLRPYQEDALTNLYSKANSLLAKASNKTLVFRAPTGSGKTIIMAEFIKKLVAENTTGLNFSFIWAAPRQLHTQSKDKLEKYYYENKTLKCSSFEELNDKSIDENEILFLNWESINKKGNIYIRENEGDFNLSSILQNTKDQGRQVILIIDESHYSTDTEITKGLRDMISAKLTIEVSATPRLDGDELVPVDRESVIQDEMIKKYVVINPDFRNDILAKSKDELSVKSQEETTKEFIITEALNKREQLAKDFSSVASNVNPLMLIQLPDRSAVNDTLKEEITGILKNKHNITVENGKLAIWLSEEKQNRDTISLNDDKAEVMIFKQAIAIGWDCPRAHILLTLRDMQSPIFTIQTVGRILRMPELKHYGKDSLNIGYIFTDMPEFSIKIDESLGYIVAQNAQRKASYQNIDLPSVHSKRHREETRFSPKFISCFLTAAEELKLKDKIDMDVKEISKILMSNGKIENIDNVKEGKTGYTTEHVSLVQQDTEIQHEFDMLVTKDLMPVFPEQRSVSRVKEAIYYFFKNNYPFKSIETAMQKVVLKDSNTQFFIDTINKAKELYDAEVTKGKSALIPDGDWNVPSSQSYNENYSALQVKLCIVEPFYQKGDATQIEKDFANYLESKTNEIRWWYKNGESDSKHFAIPYDDSGTKRSFYVDWIVKYKNGKIGLFDTKRGDAPDAKYKAEGLYKYMNEQNSKGKNLIGGIVIHQSGSWRYNDKETYEFNKDGLKSWKFLP